MKNFWREVPRPILCLAPMADVTDSAFRYIIAKYSKIPYVTYTEFVSCDGLCLAPKAGKERLLKGLEYSEIERPIVAQLFTGRPEMMEKAAKLALRLGFDGVDINMGCPDKSIEKQGAGAALIKNPSLAREIIEAAKRGVENKIPVSIKTRLGYNKDELKTWLPELLTEEPAAIVIHLRTRKEMSKVPARWNRLKQAVEMRNSMLMTSKNQEKTFIIGNGDLESVEEAIEKCKETGADGAMLGRAVFGTPWLFSYSHEWFQRKNDEKVVERILAVLVEHTKLFEEKLNGIKNFAVMKKHFKSYLSGLTNTKELVHTLMDTKNSKQVERAVVKFLRYNRV